MKFNILVSFIPCSLILSVSQNLLKNHKDMKYRQNQANLVIVLARFCRIWQDKCKRVVVEIDLLINQAESKTLEFKRDLSSLPPILKTIVAFANTAGGTIIIGYSSHDGLVGLKNIFKEEERLANAISDSIYPPIMPELEIVTLDGKELLIVRVAHWKGPFYIKKEGVPKGVYVRLGSTSRPAGPEILSELQRPFLSLTFDQQPLSDLSKESLDFKKIESAFKNHRTTITDEKLCSLGILVPQANHLVPSIGGLILFGKYEEIKSVLPYASVRCARFLGDNKAEILDHVDMEGTILDAVESVPKFIKRNTRMSAQFEEIRRKDIPEYPSVAIREVLINALVHNDYSIQGSTIQIAIYDDRLEIQNPGMLPFGFTLEDLKAGISRIRNRVIARVFHELKLIEAWGSGYKRCIEDCQKEDYPLPEWVELGAAVRVTFYPRVQTKIQTPKKPESEISERQKRIMGLFQPAAVLSFREIYNRLAGAIPERTIRYDLAILRQKRLLVSIGKGRATVWKLSE
jgi:ATP-dependent DNA helicase RecG